MEQNQSDDDIPQNAQFTMAAPSKVELPKGYLNFLQEIKEKVTLSRFQSVLAANSAMTFLYWEIGRAILNRQKDHGWGAKVVERLAYDLTEAFPNIKGFSTTNLKYMRRFAEECPECTIGQQPADQLPWFHIVTLITRISGIRIGTRKSETNSLPFQFETTQ